MAKNQDLTRKWYQRDWTFIAGFAVRELDKMVSRVLHRTTVP
jgi:hypothetical protein